MWSTFQLFLFSIAFFFLSTSSSASETGYIQTVLVDQPANYWRLISATSTLSTDEIAGTVLTAAGNYGGFSTIPGIFPVASSTNVAVYNFNVYSSYLTTPSDPTSFSVEVWSFLSGAPIQVYFPLSVFISCSWSYINGPISNLFVSQNGGVTSKFNVPNKYLTGSDNWQYFVMAFSRGLMNVYVNGVQVGMITTTYTVAPVYFQFANGYQQSLSHLAVYNYTLSPARILAHYLAANNTNPCAIGYYGANCLSSYCTSSLCLNGGTCRGETSGYTCICPATAIGAQCQNIVCTQNTCPFNSLCVLVNGVNTCPTARQCELAKRYPTDQYLNFDTYPYQAGIFVDENGNIPFLDAPGVMVGVDPLDKAMTIDTYVTLRNWNTTVSGWFMNTAYNVSLEIWVKASNLFAGSIITSVNTAVGKTFLNLGLSNSTRTIKWSLSPLEGRLINVPQLGLLKYHQFVLTRSGLLSTLYLDGAAIDSYTTTAFDYSYLIDQDPTVGPIPPSYGVRGSYDDLFISSYTMDATQVSKRYQASLSTSGCCVGNYGPTCILNYCDVNPCLNDGKCVANVTAATCVCASGFYGPMCASDYCAGSPCNGGVCNRVSGGFTCTCDYQHTGATCIMTKCAALGCQNNGTCDYTQQFYGSEAMQYLVTIPWTIDQQEIASQFQYTGTLPMIGGRYYSTVTVSVTVRASLWDVATRTLLYRGNWVTTTSVVGWQDVPFGASITLSPGVLYSIAISQPSQVGYIAYSHWVQLASAGLPFFLNGFIIDFSASTFTSTAGFPSTPLSNSIFYGISALMSTQEPTCSCSNQFSNTTCGVSKCTQLSCGNGGMCSFQSDAFGSTVTNLNGQYSSPTIGIAFSYLGSKPLTGARYFMDDGVSRTVQFSLYDRGNVSLLYRSRPVNINASLGWHEVDFYRSISLNTGTNYMLSIHQTSGQSSLKVGNRVDLTLNGLFTADSGVGYTNNYNGVMPNTDVTGTSMYGGLSPVLAKTTPYCSCTSDWFGNACFESGCTSNPCVNGATCLGTSATTYQCICAIGFYGVNCSSNYCVNNSCVGDAICTAQQNNYICNCGIGRSGTLCEVDVCRASNGTSYCAHNSTCIRTAANYTCQCPTGYQGNMCQTSIACGVVNPCQNGGVCTESGLDHTCSCPYTHTGVNCEISRCTALGCVSGGSCAYPLYYSNAGNNVSSGTLANAYNGQISPGLIDIAFTFKYIGSNNVSIIGATTLSPLHTVIVATASLWDPTTQLRLATGEITTYAGKFRQDYLFQSGVEITTGISYTVSVSAPDQVYYSYPVSSIVTPIGTPVYFTSGDTERSKSSLVNTYPNELITTPFLNSNYFMGVIARNINPTCSCPPGRFGPTCAQSFCDNSPCKNGATCNLQATNYTCSCAANWYGPNCTLSGCSTNPCLNSGNCTASSATAYACSCAVGYYGTNCTQNYCDGGNRCNYHGNCTATKSSFSCVCDVGYGVGTCNNDVCLIDPYNTGIPYVDCNEGVGGNLCIRTNVGYSCSCGVNWIGASCTTDLCSGVVCNNGGSCIGGNCSCVNGFTGANCTTPPVNYCAGNTTCGTGSCLSGVNSFTCNCAGTNNTGTTCNTPINACLTNLCSMNGNCSSTGANSSICTCQTAYIGDQCQTYTPPSSTGFVGLSYSSSLTGVSSSVVSSLIPTSLQGYALSSPLTPIIQSSSVITGMVAPASLSTLVNATYTSLNALPSSAILVPSVPVDAIYGGSTLTPGVYTFNANTTFSNFINLNGNGSYVFQMNGTATFDYNFYVNLLNGANAANIVWVINGVVLVHAGAAVPGTIIGASNITIDGTMPVFFLLGPTTTGSVLSVAGTITVINAIVATTTLPVIVTPISSSSSTGSFSSTGVSASSSAVSSSSSGFTANRLITYWPASLDYAVYASGVISGVNYNVNGLVGNASIANTVSDTFYALNALPSTTTPSTNMLHPGVSTYNNTMSMNGSLTFDGAGQYIIQVSGDLYFKSNFQPVFLNGATPESIIWVVDGKVTIGSGVTVANPPFIPGTIISASSITTTSNALTGSLFSLYGSILLYDTNVTKTDFHFSNVVGYNNISSSSTGLSSSSSSIGSSSISFSSSTASSSSSSSVSIDSSTSSNTHNTSSSTGVINPVVFSSSTSNVPVVFSSSTSNVIPSNSSSSSSNGVNASNTSATPSSSSTGLPSTSSSSSSTSSYGLTSSFSSSSSIISSSSSVFQPSPPTNCSVGSFGVAPDCHPCNCVTNSTCDSLTGHCLCRTDLFPRFQFNETQPVFVFSVGAKTESNPTFGQGSPMALYVNGLESPILSFYSQTRVILDATALPFTHPLYFTNSSLGGGINTVYYGPYINERVELVLGSLPLGPLYYQCFKHIFMGGLIHVLPNPLLACQPPPVVPAPIRFRSSSSSSSSSSTGSSSSSGLSSSSSSSIIFNNTLLNNDTNSVNSSSSSNISSSSNSSSSSSSSSSTGLALVSIITERDTSEQRMILYTILVVGLIILAAVLASLIAYCRTSRKVRSWKGQVNEKIAQVTSAAKYKVDSITRSFSEEVPPDGDFDIIKPEEADTREESTSFIRHNRRYRT